MLDRSSKVQFNLNAKQRLSHAGAYVTASNKRKKLAFAFKESQDKNQYSFPDEYSVFKKGQIEAHRGVKEGQALFRKYLPTECVKLLQEMQHWDKPYMFTKPPGYIVVDGPPCKEHNKLHLSFVDIADVDKIQEEEIGCEEIEEERENAELPCESPSDECDQDDEKEFLDENVDAGRDHFEDKGGVWKISKCVNGRLTHIHVKQAIKILLPREYISRCRQKRHWASKYLPGKEPLNPKHDIYKYCDVALKVVQKGKTKFHIGRVEAIESTKDGKEVTSFEMKGKDTLEG